MGKFLFFSEEIGADEYEGILTYIPSMPQEMGIVFFFFYELWLVIQFQHALVADLFSPL